ncbi:conjugal transfer protein TraY [Photobacterium frigidiphilum]|uniref:Relaxosome protein TraY n=1 Tax=Photobacterium frigidiphilum TaxID=264736 RepID=A0A2T3J720_9GAMM|nr:TraY domain-containing protein [Photobacterium frigidiphilum]PSU44522.1 conjugal transfer protein TraY [Photobacterium frigidiphilum]
MTSKKYISVNVLMDVKCSNMLTRSAKKNMRCKRHEAAARLKDHLLRFGGEWTEKTTTEKQ